MRDIKFNYLVKRENGYIFSETFTLEQIEHGVDLFITANHVNSKTELYRRQYIGILDKNGKEIYEGDILTVIDPNGELNRQCQVEYVSQWSGYPYESLDGFGDFDVTTIGWAIELGYVFEVIGNIYENPELLKE